MKRIRFFSLMVAAIVLGGLAIAILRAREPRYQGRTLTEWVVEGQTAYYKFIKKPNADPGHPETDPDWQADSDAVKQLASRANPVLLGWVKAKDSMPKKKLIAWLHAHPSFPVQIKTADEYHRIVWIGFWLLGNEAKPAWPVLIQWTYATDPERRFLALTCLGVSRPDKETLLPALLRLIHDPDTNVRNTAANIFHYYYPQDAEAAGVYKMFPRLKNEPTSQTTTNQPPVK